VCGHDREDLTLLAWPNAAACRALVGDGTLAEFAAHETVRARFRQALASWNEDNPANSTRIAKALLMGEPPNIDAGEITDKGYTNQRATLHRRAELVAKLYAPTLADDVIVV
jgi:feruloyl-CoA synthase